MCGRRVLSERIRGFPTVFCGVLLRPASRLPRLLSHWELLPPRHQGSVSTRDTLSNVLCERDCMFHWRVLHRRSNFPRLRKWILLPARVVVRVPSRELLPTAIYAGITLPLWELVSHHAPEILLSSRDVLSIKHLHPTVVPARQLLSNDCPIHPVHCGGSLLPSWIH